MDELNDAFLKKYDPDIADLGVRGKQFKFYAPRSIEPFLDPEDVTHDFPLWAKIWESCLVLADYFAATPPQTDQRILELGCGLGLVGVVAAAFGHRVTMTEYAPPAMEFARANVRVNGSPPLLSLRRLDWRRPELASEFDCIMGCEIIYKEADFEPIQGLLNAFLKPGGTFIAAGELRKSHYGFFESLRPDFDIRIKKKTLRSEGDAPKTVMLYHCNKTTESPIPR